MDAIEANVAQRPVFVLAQGQPAVVVDANDDHRRAVVAAGDAVVRSAGVADDAHSITLAFSSSSSCS